MTIVHRSEVMADPTHRLDAEYWIDKEDRMTTLIANGTECVECSAVVEDNGARLNAECETCFGAGTLRLVNVSPCENGPDCDDRNHHFGIGKHVQEIPR